MLSAMEIPFSQAPAWRVSGIGATLDEGQADLDEHPPGAVPDRTVPWAELPAWHVAPRRGAQLVLALADEVFGHVQVHEHGPHDRSFGNGGAGAGKRLGADDVRVPRVGR